MAAGDVEFYEVVLGSTTDMATAVAGNGIVVADNVSMVLKGNTLFIMVIKAA